MRDKDLYQKILGLAAPWYVADVDLNIKENSVKIIVHHELDALLSCPDCGDPCPLHDHKNLRQWRHLDTCQFKTVIESRLPRVKCPKDGVKQVKAPWAEPGSGFTALFEALIIDWLQEASISAISLRFGISWDQVDGIMGRAVTRGLARREQKELKHIGIDEVAYQKHHEYATIILDKETDTVIDVLDDRKEETLKDFLTGIEQEKRNKIESVSMDMWKAFIGAVRKTIPNADQKICFDRFHVAQYLCKAVDDVRKKERKELAKQEGDNVLVGTKFEWLKNASNIDNRSRRWFMSLTKSNLKTARAWKMKEAASSIWDYISPTWAEKAWKRVLGWMDRSRLAPMKKVAKTIKNHLWGIMNAIRLKQNNGKVEGKNLRIQDIKRKACGFRNRKRFKNSILFHLGRLDMYPTSLYPLSHPTS